MCLDLICAKSMRFLVKLHQKCIQHDFWAKKTMRRLSRQKQFSSHRIQSPQLQEAIQLLLRLIGESATSSI